jgi:hypothetical protein
LIENECHTEILVTYYFFLIYTYTISCLKHSPMLSCNIPPFEPGQIVIGNGWKQLTNIHGLSWEHSRTNYWRTENG